MTGLRFALLETTGRTVLSPALGRMVRLALEAFRFPYPNGTLDEAFEGFESIPVVGRDETDGHPVQVGPTGAPDSVNVILGVRREVKINDVRNPVDVDSTGRDVGGDQDPNLSVLEILQGPGPLVLTAIGVNGA